MNNGLLNYSYNPTRQNFDWLITIRKGIQSSQNHHPICNFLCPLSSIQISIHILEVLDNHRLETSND